MTAETPLPPEDAERDAWLRAALRHAPDAATGAPPALGAAILREAAVKAGSAASRRRSAQAAWWADAWAWLARPSIGAAFAGIVVATTVGVLWHDQPLPEAPRPEARVSVAPPPAASRDVESATQAQAPAPALPPAPAAAEAPRVARNDAPAAKSVAPPAALAKRRAAAPEAASEALAARGAGTATATAPAAPPAPPTSLASPAPPPVAPPTPLAAPAAPPVASADAAAVPSATLGARALRERLAVAAPAFSPAQVQAAIAADPSTWTWQRAGGAPQRVSPALAAWLASLDTATASRWLRVNAAAADAAGGSDDLVLLHEGRAAHRLRIEGGRLRWDVVAPDGAVQRWQAPLAPDAARALQARLDEATQ
jgi:hypothetical protein